MSYVDAKRKREAQKRADAKRAGRSRNCATVVYPESAPSDWQQVLSDTHAYAMVSPLHDQDQNPDGTPKKAHWHILVQFDTVKTQEQATEFFAPIGGVGAAEHISNVRGYARYLCHLDNPEKAQYNPSDVLQLGGADYIGAVGLPTDRYAVIADMIEFCEQNDVISYAQLLCYAKDHNEPWFRCLCDNGTMVLKEFLKSRYWETRVEPLYQKAPLPDGNPKGEPRQGQSPAQPGAAKQQP